MPPGQPVAGVEVGATGNPAHVAVREGGQPGARNTGKAPAATAHARLRRNTPVLHSLKPRDFAGGQFGVPTVSDILKDLEKLGRDPRPAFTTASLPRACRHLMT